MRGGPIFVLAPIVTHWLGYGAPFKIVIVMQLIYFPVTSACFDGLMSLPAPRDDMAEMMLAR